MSVLSLFMGVLLLFLSGFGRASCLRGYSAQFYLRARCLNGHALSILAVCRNSR